MTPRDLARAKKRMIQKAIPETGVEDLDYRVRRSSTPENHYLFRNASHLLDFVPPPERHNPVDGMWVDGRPFRKVRERDFGTWVENQAKANGFIHAHTHNSRNSPPGWYDYVFFRPPSRLEGKFPSAYWTSPNPFTIYIELKTETGTLTQAQLIWRAAALLQNYYYRIWRPSDRDEIERFFTLANPNRAGG